MEPGSPEATALGREAGSLLPPQGKFEGYPLLSKPGALDQGFDLLSPRRATTLQISQMGGQGGLLSAPLHSLLENLGVIGNGMADEENLTSGTCLSWKALVGGGVDSLEICRGLQEHNTRLHRGTEIRDRYQAILVILDTTAGGARIWSSSQTSRVST